MNGDTGMDANGTARAGGFVARTTALVVCVALALVLAAILVWVGATAFLIIFAGILLGVIFDAGTQLLGRILPVGRRIRLPLVVLFLAALLFGLVTWGGATIVDQFGQLLLVFDEQIGNLLGRLQKAGFDLVDAEGKLRHTGFLPDAGALFGGATDAVFALFGAFGNLVFILVLGAFFAADPGVYKRGLISLAPRDRRERLSEVLDKTGETLRHWLVGQLFGMAAIFLLTLLLLTLIGMPYAILLALTAGLLTFIPTIGPFFAGIPIVLVGLSQGIDMALWGVGVYALIEFAEGNFITPLIQRRAVALPPALTLSFQLLMGALFGLLGIALAVPLAAAGKVLVEELYVRDALGGPWREGEEDRARADPN